MTEDPVPKQIRYIVATEGCERFAFAGLAWIAVDCQQLVLDRGYVVSIVCMIVPYALLTFGEALVSATGLEVAYRHPADRRDRPQPDRVLEVLLRRLRLRRSRRLRLVRAAVHDGRSLSLSLAVRSGVMAGTRQRRSGVALALVVLAGCGRIAFAPRDDPGGPDAQELDPADAGADGAPDAPMLGVVRSFARTGTDGAGNFLPFNAVDTRYRVVAAADGATQSLATDGMSRWYNAPPANAQWITTRNNANGTAMGTSIGLFTWEVDLDVTGIDVTTPGLQLVISAIGDDGMAIDVNGTEVRPLGGGSMPWNPDRFMFPASTLNDGLNTVRFRVDNGGLVTGLFVDELALEQF